jgi:hypothetical protein
MSDSLLREAYQAYTHWHNEILKTEAYQKVKLLESVIIGFGGKVPNRNSHEQEIDTKIVPINKANIIAVAPRQKNGQGQKEKIETLAIEAILYFGGYASRSQIREYFELNNFPITESHLGWYLSKGKNLFVPNRSLGWGLVDNQNSTAEKSENTTEVVSATPVVNGSSQELPFINANQKKEASYG